MTEFSRTPPICTTEHAVRTGYYTDTVLGLARTARTLDEILRYGGKGNRESNVLHSFMLGDVAVEYAAELYPNLDELKIRQFAHMHEFPEIISGDVLTFGFTHEQLAEKAKRDRIATDKIHQIITSRQRAWFDAYERQDTPEARFVRAVDKLMPMISRCEADEYRSLYEGVGIKTIEELCDKQKINRQTFMDRFGDEFPELIPIQEHLLKLERKVFKRGLDSLKNGVYEI